MQYAEESIRFRGIANRREASDFSGIYICCIPHRLQQIELLQLYSHIFTEKNTVLSRKINFPANYYPYIYKILYFGIIFFSHGV